MFSHTKLPPSKTWRNPFNMPLTFTNKASKEMKERIDKIVGEINQKAMDGDFSFGFFRILESNLTRFTIQELYYL